MGRQARVALVLAAASILMALMVEWSIKQLREGSRH
jgi:hypothetical protein